MLLSGSLMPARMTRPGTSQAAPRLLLRLAGACITRLHLSNTVLISNRVYSQLPARGSLWPMAASLSVLVPCFWFQQQHHVYLAAQSSEPLCLGPQGCLSSPRRLLSQADDEKLVLTCCMLAAGAAMQLAWTEGRALRSRKAWPAPGRSSLMRQHPEVTDLLTCPASCSGGERCAAGVQMQGLLAASGAQPEPVMPSQMWTRERLTKAQRPWQLRTPTRAPPSPRPQKSLPGRATSALLKRPLILLTPPSTWLSQSRAKALRGRPLQTPMTHTRRPLCSTARLSCPAGTQLLTRRIAHRWKGRCRPREANSARVMVSASPLAMQGLRRTAQPVRG